MFELSKWYGDCISECGEARIAYSADLRYGPVELSYSSLLDGDRAEHFLRSGRVADSERGLCWDGPGVSADWIRQDAPLQATVFESKEGSVVWNCVMPKGRACINGIRGLGYAEHLRITVVPWKLPIRTLRWGRFLTPDTTLIWIDWQGEHTVRIVFLNGERIEAGTIDDGGLILDNGARICFHDAQVVRRGSVGSTVLAAVPGINTIAPARMLLVDECKWKSRARMEAPGQAVREGWCIHEAVTWP